MFDSKKASEYFVVGWVKGWSLRHYLYNIGGKDIDWDSVHDIFPWMPSDKTPFLLNVDLRRWLADSMPKINNLMWDAKDNADRLKLASLIEKSDCSGSKLRKNEARVEMRKSQNALAASTAMNNRSISTMRKGNGHAWNVCK